MHREENSHPPHNAKQLEICLDTRSGGQTAGEAAAHLIREGRPREAVQLLVAAIALCESADLWNDWATAQYCSGNADQTEQGYRRALKLDGSHRQSAVNLGVFLISQGQLEEGLPFLVKHKNTLTEQEKQAIGELAARYQPENAMQSASPVASDTGAKRTQHQPLSDAAAARHCAPESDAARCQKPALHPPPKLSIVMPSNRTGPAACARVLDACSCASEDVEIIVRDNSGNKEKREVLSLISRHNCNFHFVDPCGATENGLETLRFVKGDFIFSTADDDVIHRRAIPAVVDLIEQCSGDTSIVGITGEYLIEGSKGTSFFRYPPLDGPSAAQRVHNYLVSGGPNALIYSVFRGDTTRSVMSFCRTLPFSFPFFDQVVALMFLSSGKFISANRILYEYDNSNWDTPERALQTDLQYIKSCGLDGSIVRLMWLICGLEGANIVLGKFKNLDMPTEERNAVAEKWFQGMYIRFRNMSDRTDISSRFDRQAVALCDKWKQTSQILLGPLLADIAEFIALSTRDGGEKYFKFWRDAECEPSVLQ